MYFSSNTGIRMALAIVAMALFTTTAQAGTLLTLDFEFEDDGTTPLFNGQQIDDEFGTHVDISSVGVGSKHLGPAIYDTTPGVNSADPDLVFNQGNVLILQNTTNPATTGDFFDTPNDTNKGGLLILDFVQDVALVDMLFADQDEGATVTIFDDQCLTREWILPKDWTNDGGKLTLDFAAGDQPGQNSNDATFTGDSGFNLSAVDRLEIDFNGSGGIDDVRFEVNDNAVVPTPPAMLAGAGLLAFAVRRRKVRR